MKNALKRTLAIFLTIVMTIGIAPLSGFVGLKFPEIKLPEFNLFDFGVNVEAEKANNTKYIAGVFNNYTTVVIKNGDEAYASPIVVDGVEYNAEKNLISLSKADSFLGKDVVFTVEDGEVVDITTFSDNNFIVEFSVNSFDVHYRDEVREEKTIEFNYSVSNSVRLISPEYINTVADYCIKNNKHTFSDISITFKLPNMDVLYFKNGLLGKTAEVTFPLSGEVIYPNSHFESTCKIQVQKKHGFNGNENFVLMLSGILNGQSNGVSVGKNVVSFSANLSNINSLKKLSVKELLEEMKSKVSEYETHYNSSRKNKYTKKYNSLDFDVLENNIEACIIGESIFNSAHSAELSEKVWEMGCYLNDVKSFGAKEAGQAFLDSMDNRLDNEIANIRTMLRQNLESSALFNDFIYWWSAEYSVENGSAKKCVAHCPVDIVVKNEDDVTVLEITNDSVAIYDNYVDSYVHNGSKVFYLPTDEEYNIVFAATDNGTMDYSICEYTEDGIERVINYDDVPLVKGGHYTSLVPQNAGLNETVYNLHSDKGVEVGSTSDSYDENNYIRGTCGNNLTWILDKKSGVLRLNGKGDMYDYSYSSSVPWYSYRSSVKTTTISYGVTNIGNNAFSNCTSLTSVTIPDSVASIGDWVFYDCDSLTSVTIPDSVTSIGNYAFLGCTSLESVTIPDSVTSIGYDAFRGCTSLTSVTIGNNVTSIGSSAFTDCTSLTSVTIGNSVTSIGECAFYDCDSLTSVTIPDSVTSIGNYVFSGCTSLTSITVDDENKYYSSDEYGILYNKDKTALIQYPIGNERTTFTIPDSVTSIGWGAFRGCTSLTSVKIGNSVTSIGVGAFYSCESLTSVIIPNSVTSIGECAFYYCTSLTSVTIPDSVTSIGDYAFYYCYSLTSVTIGNSVTSIGVGAFYSCESLTSVTIPNSVTRIEDKTFAYCDKLALVTIPDTVTSIGKYAFYYCYTLPSVTIGNGVTSIGTYAFGECYSLTSVAIPDSVTSIGSDAFFWCDSLTDVYYNGTEEDWNEIEIGSYNSDLLNATIYFLGVDCEHEYITEVTEEPTCVDKGEITYTCIYCDEIYTETIPASEEKHKYSVYEEVSSTCSKQGYITYKCSYCGDTYTETMPTKAHTAGEWEIVTDATTETEGKKVKKCTVCGTVLETAVIPMISVLNGYCGENVTWELNLKTGVLTISGEGEMEDYDDWSPRAPWDSHRNYINTVSVENGVTNIGEYAFYNCKNLTSVAIGNSVTSIGKSAFCYCYSLTSVTIPNSVTSIGDSAFDSCENLTSIEIPDTVTSIGESVFYGCENLETAIIGKGVTNISSFSFEYCSKLKTVILPDSIKSIGEYAFYSCHSLETITFPKNLASIGVLAFSNCTSLRNIYVDDNNSVFSSDINGILYNKDKTELLIYPAGKIETSFEIPKFVESIGDFAFDNCKNLTMIVITDSVTNIGDSAFYNCTSLISVSIPDSVTILSESMFRYCTSLTTIVIPDSVTIISDSAFYGCTNLTSVIIPDSVTYIGYAAFCYCENLTEVTIGNGVTSIGTCAFESCTNLETIIIGDSVTSIENDAFQYCKSLESITIPDSVVSIGSYAFETCTNLKSIVIPDSVTNVGFAAFRNCTSLTSVTIGKSITTLSEYIFYNCGSLVSVEISDSVKIIENYAFGKCITLTSIAIPDSVTSIGYKVFENTAFYNSSDNWENNVLYINNHLIKANENISGEYIIKSGTRTVASYAFSDCEKLTNIIIPDSVISLGLNSFSYCSSLKTIIIPDSVISIGYDSFYNCTSLETIIVPDSVTNIGSSAFNNTAYYNKSTNWENDVLYIDNHLIKAKDTLSGSFIVKSGIKTIAGNAFYNCDNLISVVIPDSVTSIGESAFSHCTSLESVTIPDSITSIGECAFYECESLASIVISNSIKSIEASTFSNCDSLTSVTIPDGVTSIGDGAFYNCTHLESITIPGSVTQIGDYVFGYCNNLTDIYYNGTEEEWSEIIFENDNDELFCAIIHFIGNDHKHSYSVLQVTPPTCYEQGYTKYKCLGCGDSYIDDCVPASGHIPAETVEENRVEPSCNKEGSYDSVVYCSVCNTELSRETKSILLTGHKWSAWEVTVEPTMTEKGEKVRICSACKATDNAEIPATGITVTVTDSDGKVVEEKIIDGDLKAISFDDIADGEYTVSVSKANYTTRNYLVSSSDGEVSLSFEIKKRGDITGDGKVNTIDVARANSHAKSVTKLTGYELDCADVTGDGKVNTIDVARINSHAKSVSTLW